MARSLTAAVATELQSGQIHPHALVHFAFDSGAVRFWSGIGDLVWSGETYVGAGSLGSVGTVEEAASIRAAGAAFKLSGIPPASSPSPWPNIIRGAAARCGWRSSMRRAP